MPQEINPTKEHNYNHDIKASNHVNLDNKHLEKKRNWKIIFYTTNYNILISKEQDISFNL